MVPLKISRVLKVAPMFMVLVACGPSLDDAKSRGFSTVEEMEIAEEEGYQSKSEYEKRYLKFGFSSLDEMASLQARGYETKATFASVKEFTPDTYVTRCLESNRISYAYVCRGKAVSWRVQVISIEDNQARLRVVTDELSDPRLRFEVDSKSFLKALGTSPRIGGFYEIDGVIGARDLRVPNVDEVSFAGVLGTPDG